MGQMKKIYKLGSGCSSTAWIAQFSKGFKRKVLKRISIDENEVFCRFAWHQAKSKPLTSVKGVPMEFLSGIAGERCELQETFYHCIAKLISATQDCAKDGAHSLYLTTTFLTEVAVNYCLCKHVNIMLPSPTFCKMEGAWTSQLYGNIAMDFAGKAFLDDCAEEMSLEDFKSVLIQILIALSWAQTKVYFKHHDLHNGNIFVLNKLVPETWTTPCGVKYLLPSTKIKATIADFGLSAITDPQTCVRHARVDYELMNVDAKSWGTWTHELEGNEGYDFAVLFFCLIKDIKNLEKRKWLKTIEKKFRSMQPKLKVSFRARPLQIVSITPERMLSECFSEFIV